jgi:hypothetical protein
MLPNLRLIFEINFDCDFKENEEYLIAKMLE